MNALSAGAVLQQARYEHLEQKQYTFTNYDSIENTVSKNTSNNSIELPQEIDDLIDNKMYRRKFLKLIREGFEPHLLFLAAYARKQQNPSHYFAKVCAKARWDGTVSWVKAQWEAAKKAAYVAHKLKTQATKFIYKQIWRKVNVVRWADLAEDTPHDKPGQSREKYFAWLCVHEKELAI
jgi:leucyl aminopeptidase (aminopeptidase T)